MGFVSNDKEKHQEPGYAEAFTDREDLTEKFWDKLSLVESTKESQLISYWGFGGIGKTQLLLKIRRSLENKDWPKEYSFEKVYKPIYYTFQKTQDIVEFLVVIRTAIQETNKDLAFPLFDYCVSKYEGLMHKSAINRRSSVDAGDDLASNVFKIASLFVPNVYEAIDAGLEIWQMASDAIRKKYKFDDLEKFCDQIDKIAEDGENKLIEAMCNYIAYDFDGSWNKTRDERVYVFLLDTFERLVDSEGAEEQVVEFIKNNLCNEHLMFVVAGREELKGFDEYESFDVRHFEPEVAEFYLREKWDITDETVIKRLVDLSDGYPLYLYLGSKTYWNLSEESRSNPEEVFNIDKSELIKKYMYYLPEGGSERRILRLMSSIIHWTKDDFEIVYESVFPKHWRPDIESYNTVAESSLIQKTGEESRFLHQVVSDAIFEDQDYPEENKNDAMAAIIELYKERFEKGERLEYYSERLADLLDRGVRVNLPITEEYEKGIVSMMNKTAWDLRNYGFSYVNRYVEALKKYREIAVDRESVERALIDLMSLNDRNIEAIELAKEILRNKVGEFGEGSYKLEPDLRRLSNLYHYREYDKKIDVLERLRVSVANNPEKGVMQILNIDEEITDLYASSGEGKKAEEIIVRILSALEEENSFEYRTSLLLLNRLARNTRSKDSMGRMVNLAKAIVEKGKADKELSMPAKIDLISNLKDIYDQFSLKNLSAEVYEELKLLTEESNIFMEEDGSEDGGSASYEETLRQKRNRRRIVESNYNLTSEERNIETKELTKEIMDFIKENHPDDLDELNREKRKYVWCLKDLKDYKNALSVQYEVIESMKKEDTEDPFALIRETSRLIDIYEQMGEKQKSNEVIHDVREMVNRNKEVDREKAARVMASLSQDLRWVRDYEAAVEYMAEAISIAQENYGSASHDKVLNYKEHLADFLDDWGKKEEANAIREEIRAVKQKKNEQNPEKMVDILRKEGDEHFRRGRLKEGCEMFERAIELSNNYYGKDAYKTRSVIESFASNMWDYPKKASLLYEELLIDREGIPQKDILKYSRELSRCYAQMNRVDSAIEVLNEGINAYRESSVALDRTSLWPIESLAELMMRRGRNDEAIQLLENVIGNQLENGLNLDSTFVTLAGLLGRAYTNIGDKDKAIASLESNFFEYKEHNAGIDNRVLDLIEKQVDIYIETDDYDKAIELIEGTAEEYFTEKKDNASGFCALLRKYIDACTKLSNPQRAIIFCEKILKDYHDKHGKIGRDYTKLAEVLACAYDNGERIEDSIALLENTILEYKKEVGIENYVLRNSIYCLARTYVKTGDYIKAISLLDDAIQEIRNKNVNIDRNVLNITKEKAEILIEAGKEDQAILVLEESIEEYKAQVSSTDSTSRVYTDSLADMYCNIGAYDKTVKLLEAYINDYLKAGGSAPVGIIKKLAWSKAECNDIAEAKELLENIINEKRRDGVIDLSTVKELVDLIYKKQNKKEAIEIYEAAIEEFRAETGNEQKVKEHLLALADLYHEIDSVKEQIARDEAETII